MTEAVQAAPEDVQRYVSDGSHTYPFNDFLQELVAKGELHFCDAPTAVEIDPRMRELITRAAREGYTVPRNKPYDEAKALFDEYVRVKKVQDEQGTAQVVDGFPG